jgi:hypothetical protein
MADSQTRDRRSNGRRCREFQKIADRSSGTLSYYVPLPRLDLPARGPKAPIL